MPLLAILIVLAVAGTMESGCTTRPDTKPALIRRAAEASGQTVARPNNPSVPVCPSFPPSTPLATAPAKGDHRVILSWKESKPADSKHAGAVGYCIYRGIQGEHQPPELVNTLPFRETQCVDDLVENGKKYYYVVRAISASKALSVPSNSATARIPTRKPSHPAGRSAPLCREAPGDK
jgi:hypothetical protein